MQSLLLSRLAMRRTALVREPLPSSAETENVHAVRGVYRRMGFVPRGTFWSFPRSICGTSPLYRTVISEHFAKGRVPVCWYNASYGLVQVGRCEDRLAGTSGLLQRYILHQASEGPAELATAFLVWPVGRRTSPMRGITHDAPFKLRRNGGVWTL